MRPGNSFHVTTFVSDKYSVTAWWLRFGHLPSVREGLLEKWRRGVGGRGIFSLHDFFFSSLLVQEFFSRWNPLHEFLFWDKYCFFLSEILIRCLFCTLQIILLSQQFKGYGPLFNHVCKIFSKMHWERGRGCSLVEVDGFRHCVFFQSLPSGIPPTDLQFISRRNSCFESFVRTSISLRICPFCMVR